MLTALLAIFVLAACSNDEDLTVDENNNTETVATDYTETQNDNGVDEGETEDEKENDGSSNSESSNSSFFEVTEEPQMELLLGDKGLVQTSIGTYELTLESAEIIGTELDGEETLFDELIVLDLTFKNIGDMPIIAEDIMYNLGIASDLDHTNNDNSAKFFESIENFEGEIAPGEEVKTQFISDIYTAEEYYFRPNLGPVAAGTSNDLLWTIHDEEARKYKVSITIN